MSECSRWLAVAHSSASCMAADSSANDEVNAAPRRSLRWRTVGSSGSPQVTITPAPPSLFPAVAGPLIKAVSWFILSPSSHAPNLAPPGSRDDSNPTCLSLDTYYESQATTGLIEMRRQVHVLSKLQQLSTVPPTVPPSHCTTRPPSQNKVYTAAFPWPASRSTPLIQAVC